MMAQSKSLILSLNSMSLILKEKLSKTSGKSKVFDDGSIKLAHVTSLNKLPVSISLHCVREHPIHSELDYCSF